jgi:hypothetical protein
VADTDPGEPIPVSIMADYPAWTVDPVRGVDGLCHADRISSLALSVRGEDWMDLRDEIIRAQRTLEHGAGKRIELAEERRQREAEPRP